MRGEILISGCYNAFKSKQERSQNNNNNNNNNNSNHKGVYRFVNMEPPIILQVNHFFPYIWVRV